MVDATKVREWERRAQTDGQYAIALALLDGLGSIAGALHVVAEELPRERVLVDMAERIATAVPDVISVQLLKDGD